MTRPDDSVPPPTPSHPSALEPATLGLTLAVAVVGAVIGVQIVTALGVTPNTSIIGVLIAIMLSRLPLAALGRFRSIHRQNLVQTSISAATFGAANSLLVPIAIPMLLGRGDLVLPMLIGAACGMFIDLAMLYWFFDTRLFPGRAPWPLGVATAEAILAGDQGGRRGRLLSGGAALGMLGASGLFGALRSLPAAAFGLAFLGNVWALTMFGLGLLVRGYAGRVSGADLDALLVPHGIMVGAGLVALGQAVGSVLGRDRAAVAKPSAESQGSGRAGLVRGLGLYVVAGTLLSLLGGLHAEMSGGQMLLWVAFAAVACIAAELIVGLSAMHAGWFPAFATTLVFLLLGLLLGFPAASLGLLAGFVAAGGPAFADAGFDFKTGWSIRGRGRDPEFELAGRRQQLLAAVLGFAVALGVVGVVHSIYFRRGLFPPVVRVYATTIHAGLASSSARQLLWWAIPGAAIQLLGGARRQLGILFATGLLIVNLAAGWAVLAGVLVRVWLARRRHLAAEASSTIFAAGLVAGDAVWAFVASLLGI